MILGSCSFLKKEKKKKPGLNLVPVCLLGSPWEHSCSSVIQTYALCAGRQCENKEIGKMVLKSVPWPTVPSCVSVIWRVLVSQCVGGIEHFLFLICKYFAFLIFLPRLCLHPTSKVANRKWEKLIMNRSWHICCSEVSLWRSSLKGVEEKARWTVSDCLCGKGQKGSSYPQIWQIYGETIMKMKNLN